MTYNINDILKIAEESRKNCKLLSDKYLGNKHELEFICSCGELFSTTITRFKSGKQQCNKCGRSSKRPKRNKLSYDCVVEEIEFNNSKLMTSRQEYDSKVFNEGQSPTQVRLEILCNNCMNNSHKTNLRRLREREKYHCYYCSMKKRSWSFEEVKIFIEKDSNSGCKLLESEYNGVMSDINIKCWCGKHFKTKFHYFKDNNKRNCGNHNLSNGEFVIMSFLDKRNIKYQQQYTFDNCRNEKILRFDFAIFNEDSSLKMLIEYQGIQHFEPKGFGIKDEKRILDKFNSQRKNDKIKKRYCIEKGIDLLIIPYSDNKNIETILNQLIN